jgi:serine/threonine-protein kinase
MESIAGVLVPGTIFAGRYQVIEELGRGGMGCVYRVFDKTLQEEVALKFINPEIAAHKRTLDRFSHELKTARKIVHKNVGRVFDLEERDGVHYIAMEYVQGENLRSLLLRAGPLSLGKTLRIAAQVCSGLAEAHSHGIVHRDLKSQNIMIDRQGNARIMDFGIALTPEAQRGTATAHVAGTPESMSPEQAAGSPVDRRSDIYSLGVVLYHMVTGELPFIGDTPLAVAMKHKTEAAPDPRALNRQIPEGLSRLILKCLEKDPARRFQDVRDIVPELERIGREYGITGDLEGEPATGHRSGTATRPSRIFGKKVAVPAFTLPAAILVIAGFAAYWFLFGPGRPVIRPGWKTSIAVLPIRTPPDLEDLRESLTGDIITRLFAAPEIRVIPSHTMWLYKDTKKPLQEIGEELNVENVLDLSLRRAGESFVVTAQLNKARENAVRDSWQEGYAALSQIEERLPVTIAERLQLSLTTTGKRVVPPDAYVSYLKGRNAERQYSDSMDTADFFAAQNNYQGALRVHPDYAEAWEGLGNIYQLRFFSQDPRDRDDFENMRRAYEKAFEIDPSLAEANVGLAWMHFFKEDLSNAHKFYREALKLAPNNAEVLFNAASFLRDIGLYDQAIPLFEKARAIDPGWITYVTMLAWCRMLKGDYEEAVKDVVGGLAKEPKNEDLRLLHARLLLLMGKPDEAVADIDEVEKVNPRNTGILRLRALFFAAKGKKKEALDLLKGKDPVIYTVYFSYIYAAFGMNDEAIANIEEVINHGFEKLGTYTYAYGHLRSCPYFQGLRNDPRFRIILENAEREHQRNLRLYGNM